MKTKELALSIILHAFLGYLWLLFIDHIVSMVNALDNVFVVGGPILIIGTYLFGIIVKRVAPFNNYKIAHPFKLAGLASFSLVVVVHLFVFNLI